MTIWLIFGIIAGFLGNGVCSAQTQDAPTLLSLEEAITFALQNNLNLQSSRDQITNANISLETANSAFGVKIRPEISGVLQQTDKDVNQNYGLLISKRLQSGGEFSWRTQTRVDESAEESHRTDLSFSYTQPLLRGRGTLAATQNIISAEHSLRSQSRSLLLAQQQLIVSVASAYYQILRDQMMMEVNQRAVERAKLLQQAADAKLKVGMASKMDVFRAELQVLTAENGLVDAQESFQNTKQRFNLLLGADVMTEFRLTSPLEYEPMNVDRESLVRQAAQNRVELQDAQDNVTNAEQQVRIARQNLYPPLDVSVHYTFRGEGDSLKKSADLDDSFWGVEVNSSFNLDFASDRAAYQQAQLALNGTLRTFQSMQQEITLEVLQTINAVLQAQARVELQRQSVTQAEQQLELSELRYKKGLSDNLDVIDAEEAVITAKTNYYSTIVQHLIAKLRLKQVTGVLDIREF